MTYLHASFHPYVPAVVQARDAAFGAPLGARLVPEAALERRGALRLVLEHHLPYQRQLIRLADAAALEVVW